MSLFEVVDEKLKHLHIKRLFTNEDNFFVYNHHFLLDETNLQNKILRFYGDEEGYCPFVTEYYYNNILTITITNKCEEGNKWENYDFKIELINENESNKERLIKTININRLTKTDAFEIKKFIVNKN